MDESFSITDDEEALKTQLAEELENLNEINRKAVKKLAQHGAQLPPSLVLSTKIDVFVSLFLGEDTAQRLAFEVQFARVMAEQLDEAEKSIVRAKLLAK